MERSTYNLSAGPAMMPEPVLKQIQKDVWDIADTGMGVLELSHRGPIFTEILERTTARMRKLASIPDTYDVLYLTGGATQQFWQVPANFLGKSPTSGLGDSADYWITGSWAKKAHKEGGRFGTVHEAASSADKNFSYIPRLDGYSDDPTYVHFTRNNTIFGTQHAGEPPCPEGAFLVCDASSDIFSRPIEIERYGLIYAGAQKNLGPAGVTVVIVRKDLVAGGSTEIPPQQQYRTFAENDSCPNTPPTFSIYAVGEVLQWLLDFGGLEAMKRQNESKAAVLYDYLDESGLFNATVPVGSRSSMNPTFVTGDADVDGAFMKEAKAAGFDGLKGHRSVGGMRASIYNAFPPEGVEKLVRFMKDFESKR